MPLTEVVIRFQGRFARAHGHRLGIEYMRRFALRIQSHGLISKTDESSGSVCSIKTLTSCSCAMIAPSRERFETKFLSCVWTNSSLFWMV